MNNYSEQIFQSIDTIISQRLNEVKFDKTITCEVIAGVKDYPNKYWVSDGATKFQACVADSSRTYTEKQKVYVLIPNGDYNSADKVIIGSYTADELPKSLYTNPFDHLVYSSKILFTVDDKYVETSTDTESLVSMILPNIAFNYSNTTSFDYIGLNFSFNTTELYGMKKGNYGIQFTLKNKDTEIFTSAIDSSQLYGDIYNFNSLMKMQHLFPIPAGVDITQANELVINLYQKGNFDIAKKKIYLNEATFYFGYDVEKINSNKLILHLDKSQSLIFKKSEDEEKLKRKLYLEWQDTDLNKIYSLDQEQPSSEKYNYTIYWCKYIPGYKKGNGDIEETGVYWKTIETNSFSQEVKLEPQNNTQQFKVGVKYRNEEERQELIKQQTEEINAVMQDTSLTTEEKQKKINEIEEKYKKLIDALWKYFESNVLIFTNEDVKPEPGSTNNSEDSIKLTCSDSGVYNYYMAQGPIVDYSYTREERTITASFLDGYDIEKDSKEVIWEIVGIKNDNETMIKFNTEKSTNKTLVFTIKDEYLSGRNDLNTILCTATLPNGEIRRGKVTLHFGEISTAGSQYAFNLHFEDNKSCLHPINGNSLIVSATLQRRDGETILPLPDIEWSIEGNNKDKNNTVILSAAAGGNYSCTLTYMLSSGFPEMADNEYYSATLKAVIKDFTIDNGLTTDLTTYLPIPLGANNCDYISGITSVSYFTNGPSKMVSKKKYQIYGTDIPAKVQWLPDSFKVKIEENNEEKEVEKPFLPYVDSKKTTLVVPTFPAWENNQETLYYGIVAKNNDIILWMQPIVLKQNGYDDDFVNSYSNALTIDEGRNAIGVATLVVGRKEEGNKLTGIEMGELYQVDNNGKKITYLESGLYGKQKNINMFYLTNKGAFFVGDGDNYISFNDEVKKTKNALMIKTSLFNLNSDNIIVNSNGLIIKGGDFVIKDKKNVSQLYFDNDTGELSLSGVLKQSGGTDYCKIGFDGSYSGFYYYHPKRSKDTEIFKIWPGYVKGEYSGVTISVDGSISFSKGIKPDAENSYSSVLKIEYNNSFMDGKWNLGSDQRFTGDIRTPNSLCITQSQTEYNNQKYYNLHLWSDNNKNGVVQAHNGNLRLIANGNINLENYLNCKNGADIRKVDTLSFLYNSTFISNAEGSPYYGPKLFYKSFFSCYPITTGGIDSSSYTYTNWDGWGTFTLTGEGGQLRGNWSLDGSGIATTSDQKSKKSIQLISEKFNHFFDLLKPSQYQYKNGTSDRYHTGFIAQEIEQGLNKSNISTKNFAGLIIDNNKNYYLRYSEFIALNTWQIQKLKQRVTELENEIKEIKQNENY